MAALVRLRRAYGAHPAHLMLLVASFALAGYVVSVIGLEALWDPDVWWQSIVVWFLGAVVVHDLVLFPLYAAADRTLLGVLGLTRGRRRGSRAQDTPVLPAVNHVRIPFLATGLITLLFFPGIIQQGSASYLRATGQTQEPFLQRWLLLCALIFLTSAVVYTVRRLALTRRAGRPGAAPREDDSP